jgi:hypothetical protein
VLVATSTAWSLALLPELVLAWAAAAKSARYGIIVFVVVNAILLASWVKVRLISDRHNLVPVLAYWPVLLGSFLVVTLIVFFRA